MKLLFASDLHGSATAAEAVAQRIRAERPDRVILLGDLLYHGPRNALPDGYDPARTAQILNEFAAITLAVKGNCEAEVDQWMLDFPCMAEYALIETDGVCFFATHGHRARMTPDEPPALRSGSVFACGHTHVKELRLKGDLILLNPGSAALPKDGSQSYATFERGALYLKAIDGTTMSELSCA